MESCSGLDIAWALLLLQQRNPSLSLALISEKSVSPTRAAPAPRQVRLYPVSFSAVQPEQSPCYPSLLAVWKLESHPMRRRNH